MIILRLHFSAISFVYPRVLRWLTSLCQFLVISLIDDRTEILFLNDILDLSKSLILVDKLLPVFSDLIYLLSSSYSILYVVCIRLMSFEFDISLMVSPIFLFSEISLIYPRVFSWLTSWCLFSVISFILLSSCELFSRISCSRDSRSIDKKVFRLVGFSRKDLLSVRFVRP